MVATNYSSETMKMVGIGQKIRAALWCAQIEKRLVVGLNEAVKILSKSADKSLFCILASDTLSHIQEVLLESYCYEYGIYIIKVDTEDKLSRILGTRQSQSCVLIQKSERNAADITAIENEIIDYCVEVWNESPSKPIILP